MISKFYYSSIMLIALTGIGFGFLINPKDQELAFMHFQDRNFAKSFQIYERLWRQGDHSINVIMPLSKLYLKYGELNKASQIIEEGSV